MVRPPSGDVYVISDLLNSARSFVSNLVVLLISDFIGPLPLQINLRCESVAQAFLKELPYVRYFNDYSYYGDNHQGFTKRVKILAQRVRSGPQKIPASEESKCRDPHLNFRPLFCALGPLFCSKE